ncbi:HK97 gp10 family phage protein [Calidifontibacter sp. DB0510]|uniref:HK97 gp10 family phage protein n=1 Tax=Metallococcus carri TaxID=1656884 RepID=A0A967B1P9_9MICO|nr:HK97 gp10 family phage protein [Metallococcus carri]NHN55775.1 HK97 gp10 family phage protein [Metallococcus carri]NOP38536.1 HK97 gp10 family phage protein [Calidifontibacter sp. DB2511S]
MARPSARVEVDEQALQRFLDTDAIKLATVVGEKVAARARTTAPVLSGAYRDGIDVQVARDASTGHKTVRVGSSVAYTMVIEARTGNLARALDAAREA